VSRKLLAFLLSELTTVRVICKVQGCRSIVEVPLDRLWEIFQTQNRCRFCGQELVDNSFGLTKLEGKNHFQLLAFALEKFKDNSKVDIEFVIPDAVAPSPD
jgi:hypothetical protein